MNALEESYKLCKRITLNHYENFPVASLLIPAKFRHHIFAVYAFARLADDIADEGNNEDSIKKLKLIEYKTEFLKNDFSKYKHFPAVINTINKFSIPHKLFIDLIDAFIQDTEKKRYNNFEDLLDYCSKSANPVGRILLHIFGIKEDKAFYYSDLICTGLQLTNFWQDIKIDFDKDRCYLPIEELNKFSVNFSNLSDIKYENNFIELLKFQVDRTRKFLIEGKSILKYLSGRFKFEISFTIKGGLLILDKIEQLNYNTLAKRPKLNLLDKFTLLF